jgi:Zn-dependent peptidase ImmA (M78 family)
MYQLRGQRVVAIPEHHIARVAQNLCKVLQLSTPAGRRKKRLDKAFEDLWKYSITLRIVDDKDWKLETGNHIVGHYDPHTLTISVPNYIYLDACAGERFALSVILHELGHLVLAHQASLHYSSLPATEEEDTEYQADLFSDYCLSNMGFDVQQLCFEFY